MASFVVGKPVFSLRVDTCASPCAVHQIKQIFCATHHLNLKGRLNSIDFIIVGSSSSRFPKKSSDCKRRLLTFAGAKKFLLVLH